MIHVHDILKLISNANTPYTLSSLEDEIKTLFGDSWKIESCNFELSSYDELIQFMIDRQKIVITGKTIKMIESGDICDN